MKDIHDLWLTWNNDVIITSLVLRHQKEFNTEMAEKLTTHLKLNDLKPSRSKDRAVFIHLVGDFLPITMSYGPWRHQYFHVYEESTNENEAIKIF